MGRGGAEHILYGQTSPRTELRGDPALIRAEKKIDDLDLGADDKAVLLTMRRLLFERQGHVTHSISHQMIRDLSEQPLSREQMIAALRKLSLAGLIDPAYPQGGRHEDRQWRLSDLGKDVCELVRP